MCISIGTFSIIDHHPNSTERTSFLSSVFSLTPPPPSTSVAITFTSTNTNWGVMVSCLTRPLSLSLSEHEDDDDGGRGRHCCLTLMFIGCNCEVMDS